MCLVRITLWGQVRSGAALGCRPIAEWHNPCYNSGMIPLLASGAASLASVLVNRAAGASSSSAGTVALDPKAFQKALSKASQDRPDQSPAQQQAVALTHRLMHSPEVEAALTSQPVGSVSAVEVRADGAVVLQTARGAVAVQLTESSRILAQQVYAASALTGVTAGSGAAASGSGTQGALRLPVQGASLR